MKPTLPICPARQLTARLVLLTLILLGFGQTSSFGQVLFNYTNLTSGSGTVAAHIAPASLSRGLPDIAQATDCMANQGYGSHGWPTTNVFNVNTFNSSGWYVEFTLDPDAGYGLKVTGMSARSRRENPAGNANDGPIGMRYGYSTNGGATWTTVNPGNPQSSNLCASSGVNRVWPAWDDTLTSNPIIFRIYGLSSGSARDGDLFLHDVIVFGTVCASNPSIAPAPDFFELCYGMTSVDYDFTMEEADTYGIDYDDAGFVDVPAGTPVPSAPGTIALAVPANTAPGTYTGTLTVSNSCGFSTDYGFSIQVHPLPDVTISVLPAEICAGDDVTLTFTDDAATGHLFTITADLVDDNGTSVGEINFSGVPSGASAVYTEGVDFDGDVNGSVSLANIVVTDETTHCVNDTEDDISVTVNPLPNAVIAATDESGVADDAAVCVGGSATLTASGGVSYLWNTGATTAEITVSPLATTTYTVMVTSADNCTASATQTITVNPNPYATFSVVPSGSICPGTAIEVYFDESNWPGGTEFTVGADVSPLVFGLDTLTFYQVVDGDHVDLIEGTDFTGDLAVSQIIVTEPISGCSTTAYPFSVDVLDAPAFGFTAASTGDPGGSVDNSAGPGSISVDFCTGQYLTLSAYTDNGNIGYVGSYTTTGNTTYGGGGLGVGPVNFTIAPGAAAGFFGGVYGDYGLSAGTFGQIIQIFTPYVDVNGNESYDPGTDCLGDPITLTYNIYGPIVVNAVRNDNNLCSGENVDYTISTTSTQNVLFDLTLSENSNGGNPADLDDDNTLPVVLTGLSMNDLSSYHFTQVINNAAGTFDRGRVNLNISNVRYANTDVSCGATVNNPNANTTVFPEPRLAAPVDKLVCDGGSTNLDIDLDPSSLPSVNGPNAGFDVGINWTVSAIDNVAGASNYNSNLTIHTALGGDVSNSDVAQVLTLVNPALPGSVTYTITPRSMGPGGGYNGNDCFGDPITIIVTVLPPAEPVISGPFCVHEGAEIMLTADNDVDAPATFVSGVWSSTPNVTLIDTFDQDTVLVTGYVAGGTATIYYTVTDDAGCVSTAEYEVEVLDPVLLTHVYTGDPVTCGEEFTVSVEVSNFCDINTLDYPFTWDPNVFQLVTFDTPTLLGGATFGAVSSGPGELYLFFYDDGNLPYGNGLTDGTVVLTYTLRAIGASGTYNVPDATPAAEAYNSGFQLVPVNTIGVSVPIEPITLQLAGNPVICPGDDFIHLQFSNVDGNPDYYVIDFDPLSSPPFPDIQEGTFVPGDGEIIIPTPANIQHGSYQATLVVSNTAYGCVSDEYLFSIIVDQTPPTASNPDPVNVACVSSVPAPNVNVVDDEADNCTDAADLMVRYESGLSTQSGTGCVGNPLIIHRVYSVTDEAGNTTYVTQTITALDNVAPTISTSGLSNWYPSGLAAINAAIARANATKLDNCTPPVGITVTLGPVDTAGCAGTIVLFVSDACGNISPTVNTTFHVTIDRAKPVVTAGIIDDCYDEDETPTAPYFEYDYAVQAALAATTASDDCDASLDITASVSGTDCHLTITVTATDDCGKSNSVTYNTRVENDAPVFSLNPAIIALKLEDVCFDTEAEALDSAIDIVKLYAGDDCTPPGDLQYDAFSSGGCPAEIMVVVTDYCGNPTTITFTGVHIDTEDPQVAPDYAIATCFKTLQEAYDSLAKATHPYDNCTDEATLLASVQVTDLTEVGDLNDDCLEYDIELTFTDNCENTVSITYTYINIDNVAPTAEPLDDLEYTCIDDVDEPNESLVIADDNCGVEDIVWISDDLPTSCPGTGTRTYRVYDCAGNFVDVVQNIIVNDNLVPTWLTTPANNLDRTIECDDLISLADALLLAPEAEDNCGNASIVLVSSTPLNTCAGGYVRSWKAVDDCGNESTNLFTQTITIVDNDAPTWLTLPEALDAEVECDDAYGLDAALNVEPEADDNCSDVTITMVNRDYFTYGYCLGNYLGYWETEWTATDECGNTSTSFYQYVYIYDNTEPEWNTEEGEPYPVGLDFTISCSDVVAYDFANSLSPQAGDNCDQELDLYKNTGAFVPSGDCPGEGSFTNTWTAVDDCGNPSVLFTQTIHVIDNTPPTFDPVCQFMPLNLFTSEGYDCHEGISLSVGDELDYSDSWTVAGFVVPPLAGCIEDDCSPIESITAEVVSITDVPGQTVEINSEYTAECVRQITVSFLLYDACGNVQPELFVCMYNIIDDTAPEVFCSMSAQDPIDNCYASVAAAEADVLADINPCDNCTDAEDLTVEIWTVGTCNAEISVVVKDCAGNPSDTIRYHTRIDNAAPTMVVHAIPTCYASVAAAQAAAIAGTTITDDCDSYGNLSVMATTSGVCPATITVTATDQCGNSRSVAYSGLCIGMASEVVIAPEASNLNVDCDTWQDDIAGWLANHGGASAPGADIVWTYSPVDPATALQMSMANCTTHTKSVVVTFRATNGCGNFDETTATFSLTDLVPPTANAIPNASFSCIADTTAPNVNLVTGEADNCGGTPVVALFANSKMGTGCPGNPLIIARTYSVTDAFCNTTYITQTITVVDNVAPTFTAPGNMTISVNAGCVYNASPAVTGDVTNEADNCTPSGPGLQAFYTDAIAPGNSTPVKYIITRTWKLLDACGNSAIPRVQTITVLDETLPTISGCPSNVVLPGSIIETICGAYAAPITQPTFSDNCPDASISYVLSGATSESGNGFVPGTTVFKEGETTVTYTVTDAVGNTATCSFTVTVNCITISGRIIWEHNDVSGVKDATVKLTQPPSPVQLGSDLSDTNGNYDVSVPSAGTFRITPVKNINRLNGVTSADATAITNHITSPAPGTITDPYKKVCADVNRSGVINTQDAQLITQCLAGNPTALATFNVFWRFTPTLPALPATTQFVVPAFSEFKDVPVTTLDVSGVDFFGMKIGDVAAPWADPQTAPVIPPLVWMLQDQTLVAGTEIELNFAASNFNDLASYQMALDFDPSQLQFVGFQPTGALPMNLLDNFGAYHANIGELRNVWSAANGNTLSDGTVIFRAKFKVLVGGQKLSEVLKLDESEIPCIAYNEAVVPTPMKLVFTESVGTANPLDLGNQQLQLLQNRPNPFSDATTIGFILPEACEAHIRILDISGRALASYDREYSAGYHELDFRMENAASYGVLFCELVTPQGKRTIKMMTAK